MHQKNDETVKLMSGRDEYEFHLFLSFQPIIEAGRFVVTMQAKWQKRSRNIKKIQTLNNLLSYKELIWPLSTD